MTREELERLIGETYCAVDCRHHPLSKNSRSDMCAAQCLSGSGGGTLNRARANRAIRLVVEACAKVARDACLVPPDGGSPTEAERRVAQAAHDNIRAAFLPPEATDGTD